MGSVTKCALKNLSIISLSCRIHMDVISSNNNNIHLLTTSGPWRPILVDVVSKVKM